jgi:hypothetical protein
MKEKTKIKIMGYSGISIFFLGLGWFLGRTFGKIEIKLKEFFIILGIVLILASFLIPRKK